MTAVEVAVECELVIMGPPEPAELALVISLPCERRPAASREEETLLVEVQVRCASADLHECHTFGTMRYIAETFLSSLRHAVSTGEGSATLGDDDVWNYLRIQPEDQAEGTFKASGRFWSVPTDIESDPEEADFFSGAAVAAGFQGIRIHKAQLARAVAELESGLPKLTW